MPETQTPGLETGGRPPSAGPVDVPASRFRRRRRLLTPQCGLGIEHLGYPLGVVLPIGRQPQQSPRSQSLGQHPDEFRLNQPPLCDAASSARIGKEDAHFVERSGCDALCHHGLRRALEQPHVAYFVTLERQ